MRLLNVKSRQLREFFDDKTPYYAILSHTWGEDEVLFQDLENRNYINKNGYTKIDFCCQQADADGLEWVWVDTCCINKDSSAELSEAINSMFLWYKNSAVCYSYLSDVSLDEDPSHPSSDFRESLWFTRGWTLQELLAPERRVFYDANWSLIGAIQDPLGKSHFTLPNSTRTIQRSSWSSTFSDEGRLKTLELGDIVEDITGIRESIITHQKKPATIIVAEKMAWASTRQTSRVEDMAYCLLGIFGVNMPLLYGEGSRAFVRLQEEIIRVIYDHSILAWGFGVRREDRDDVRDWDLFARHPCVFGTFGDIASPVKAIIGGPHYSKTNLGLHIDLPIISFEGKDKSFIGENRLNLPYALALLDVSVESTTNKEGRLAMPLILLPGSGDHRIAVRCRESMPFIVPTAVLDIAKRGMVYLSEGDPFTEGQIGTKTNLIALVSPLGWVLSEFFPPTGLEVQQITREMVQVVSNTKVKNILFRYYHPEEGSLLLLLTSTRVRSMHAIHSASWWATIATVANSKNDWSLWRTLLEPDYEEFNFEMLLKNPLRWGKSCKISQGKRAILTKRHKDWKPGNHVKIVIK